VSDRVSDGPPIDASRPSGLRFAGFGLAVVSALLMGFGAIRPWITVGVRADTNTNTSIVGVDLVDGVVVLICAGLMLVSVLMGRLVRGRSVRMGLAVVTIVAGAIGALVAGAFVMNGVDRGPVLDAIGIPREQWGDLQVFRDVEFGVYLALAGAICGVIAGILTLAWAQRTGFDPEPDEASETG
jgi:hypothetical protein